MARYSTWSIGITQGYVLVGHSKMAVASKWLTFSIFEETVAQDGLVCRG